MAIAIVEIFVFLGGVICGIMVNNMIKAPVTEKALSDEQKNGADALARSYIVTHGDNARQALLDFYEDNRFKSISPYTDAQYRHALAIIDKELRITAILG